MIDADKRQAIYCLYKDTGMGIREISRRMHIAVNTVSGIIEQKGVMPASARKDKILVEEGLLRKLHNECDGWAQRIHERLMEEHGLGIGYSTLTRMIRDLELDGKKKQRCDQVADKPGEEMQHDTTVYKLKIGEACTRIVASILYFRYSKVRYLKFYRSFNRFNMKCFIHETLMFWGYAAAVCIIDNTNLARLSGSGARAVIAPEMEQFAERYGFTFKCHAIKHPNRKAGNERSFYTVESNFIPGRRFESLEDLNAQAMDWATVRMPTRPVAKTGLIPAAAFEYEQPYLKKVPLFVTPPYLVHNRRTDQYGYASCDGNYYWIPETSRHDVKLLQYSDRIKIYHKRKLLCEYELPPDGVKNAKIRPEGQPVSRYQPNNRKRPTAGEEKKLRAVSPEISAYLDFAIKEKQSGKKRHGFIRRLYGLYQRLDQSLFIKSINRALKYRVIDIATIERIAVLYLRTGSYEVSDAGFDAEYKKREAYLKGRFTDEADLSKYKMSEDDDD
ncbi:MAG: helix-turn-helix domain-containing protein [Deltaproteobacteria bacterium]|nr:MAG: helix-turn-helix domain-containing protein [Deltaproteobacteria bacterium]